ncbi:MAG: pilus assembly protein [Clostridiales bacterium]|jgi:hypothetical protein|nr:pilus assembly protein [Clostridiales bacterium]
MRLSVSENTNGRSGGARASVTVEAALALPIFIFVLLSLAFLIQALRTHDVIHSSLINAANTMALQYYTIADLERVNKGNNGAVTDRTFYIDEGALYLNNISHNMNEFYSMLEKYNQEVSDDSYEIYKKYINEDSGTVNPISIEASILRVWYMYEYIYARGSPRPMSSDEGLDLFKNYLTHEFYKRANRSYGIGEYAPGQAVVPPNDDRGDDGRLTALDRSSIFNRQKWVDRLLNSYNIVGGFNGISFSDGLWSSDFPIPTVGDADSNYFTINVRYEVKIPFPYQTIGKIPITHRVKVRAWGIGD